MRITTKLVLDMNRPLPNGQFCVICHEGFEYCGPVALCKGDPTASQTEQSQSAFGSTLQQAFQTQFATQQNTLAFLNNTLQKQATDPTGFGATDLAATRTSATDQIAQEAQNAQRVSQNREALQGGANLPSGVNAQINASEATAAGQAEAGAQNNITMKNNAVKLQQQQDAENGLLGVAAQENGTGTAGAANGAASSVANLSGAVAAADGPGIGQILGGVTTGVGGAWALGGFKHPH